jgi:integrase/recombinase XerD
VRTVLLDDRGYVALLRLYLARAGYTAGPLFRASINGSGGPLSYDAAHHRREGYCSAAGVGLEIHQLRHAHTTELINSGVSIEAVRRRLGHASTETTQRYALPDDKVAAAEIRAARRRRGRSAKRRSATNSPTTRRSAWALILCTVAIGRSTSVSVISRRRQYNNAASSVTLTSSE